MKSCLLMTKLISYDFFKNWGGGGGVYHFVVQVFEHVSVLTTNKHLSFGKGAFF